MSLSWFEWCLTGSSSTLKALTEPHLKFFCRGLGILPAQWKRTTSAQTTAKVQALFFLIVSCRHMQVTHPRALQADGCKSKKKKKKKVASQTPL